jgi:hypothetical protein
MSYFGSQGDYWGERAVPTQEVPRNTTIRFGSDAVIPRSASVGTESYSKNDFIGFSRDRRQELSNYNRDATSIGLPTKDKWDASMARRGGKTKKSYKKYKKGKTRKTHRKKQQNKKTRKYKKKN